MRRFFGTLALGAGLVFTAAPAAVAEDVSLTLLLVNDIYKMGEPDDARGGFARLAAIVKAERAKGGNVLYAHAGDTISPSLMAGFDQGAHVVELLNMAPPDVFVPGNHEFDFGKDVFLARMGELNAPKLAANLRNGDGAEIEGFADTMMKDYGPLKVGIVGLTADDSPVKSSPGDLTFTATLETGAAQAAALREAGADIVIAVVHANRTQDQALFESRAYDIILTGDDHDLALFFDGRTAMVESKEEGEYVTAVDLTVSVEEKDGKKRVSWWPNFRIIDSATVAPDPDTNAIVERLNGELSKELDVVLGTTANELDSRKATVRSMETAMGNLVADAMRAATGADIAITNGGGIRGNKVYAPGSELTRRDILTELPFGNLTLMLEVTGETVKAALENGVSKVEEGAGRFPHVSGLSFTYDPAQPAGSRVTSVMVGGAALDAAATYKVATNDYMARGGDGYGAFRKGKVLLGPLDGKLMANDVMAYVRAAGSISAGVEGRSKTP